MSRYEKTAFVYRQRTTRKRNLKNSSRNSSSSSSSSGSLVVIQSYITKIKIHLSFYILYFYVYVYIIFNNELIFLYVNVLTLHENSIGHNNVPWLIARAYTSSFYFYLK